MEISYKLNWIKQTPKTLEPFKPWSIEVSRVAKFIDWKFDRFIKLEEAVKFLDKVVFYEKDFDSVMSKSEKKRKKLGEITLF